MYGLYMVLIIRFFNEYLNHLYYYFILKCDNRELCTFSSVHLFCDNS